MKKLLLLAVMLAVVVLVAAIPALAQNIQPAAGVESNTGTDPAHEEELICLLPEGCDTDVDVEPVPGIEPAPGDVQLAPGGDVQLAPGDVQPAPGNNGVEPGPGDVEPAPDDSGGCSNADEISLRSAPEDDGGDDSGSVIAASTPGCSYILVEE